MNLEDLSDLEQMILAIIMKKRRKMTSKQIAEELNKLGVKTSRPTIAKYLGKLKKLGFLTEGEDS